MPELSIVQTLAIWALPVLFAITFHEVAHGYAARALGDRTAEMLGRLSLNPARHIDPVGTLLVPALLLALGGFLFGWAKPVPVVMANLRRPRRDMAIVAVAGPLTNLAMAIAWAALLRVALAMGAEEGLWLGVRFMAIAGITINLVLLVLNLLPLPPLDGSRVLASLLPPAAAQRLDRLEPWGLVILVVLMATGILGKILYWPLVLGETVLLHAFGIDAARLF